MYKTNNGDYLTFKGQIERESGVSCQKLDIIFNVSDSRVWSALINSPKKENIIVTFHVNRTFLGDESFDILTSKRTYMGIGTEYVLSIIEPLIESLTENNQE